MLVGDLRGAARQIKVFWSGGRRGRAARFSLTGEIAYGADLVCAAPIPAACNRPARRLVLCQASHRRDLRHDLRIWLSLAETRVWRLDCKTPFSLDIPCRRIRKRISGRQSRWATHSSNPAGKTRRRYGSERHSQPTPLMSMLHADWSRFSWINDCWRKRLRHYKVACCATLSISVFWLNKSELGSLSMTKNCGKTRSRGLIKLWNSSHGM